jgi:hypothetical protein
LIIPRKRNKPGTPDGWSPQPSSAFAIPGIYFYTFSCGVMANIDDSFDRKDGDRLYNAMRAIVNISIFF